MRRTLPLLLVCGSFLLAPFISAQPQSPAPKLQSPAPAPKPLPDSPEFGVYPIAYREIILKFLETRLLDAGSAQIEWGEPKQGTIKTPEGKAAGYLVLLTVNSRNKFGMYTGKQKYQILLRNGEVIHAGRG